MIDEEQKLGKFMVGRVVEHENRLWVVVQHLSGLNLSACRIRGKQVLWRSPKFIGEEWEPTNEKPVKIPESTVHVDPLNDGFKLCLESPEGI